MAVALDRASLTGIYPEGEIPRATVTQITPRGTSNEIQAARPIDYRSYEIKVNVNFNLIIKKVLNY